VDEVDGVELPVLGDNARVDVAELEVLDIDLIIVVDVLLVIYEVLLKAGESVTEFIPDEEICCGSTTEIC
jgi:hypothetical protein